MAQTSQGGGKFWKLSFGWYTKFLIFEGYATIVRVYGVPFVYDMHTVSCSTAHASSFYRYCCSIRGHKYCTVCTVPRSKNGAKMFERRILNRMNRCVLESRMLRAWCATVPRIVLQRHVRYCTAVHSICCTVVLVGELQYWILYYVTVQLIHSLVHV